MHNCSGRMQRRGGSTNGIIYGSVATLKHANVVLRHKLNDMMEMKARFWKRKRVSVSSFQCNPFTYIVRESGNESVFPFPVSMVIHLLTLLESSETETCFRFLYSSVCLWSIVINSANRESGNGNVFLFLLLESLSVVNSGQ